MNLESISGGAFGQARSRRRLELNLGGLDTRITREQEETERKFREIDNRNGHIKINNKVCKIILFIIFCLIRSGILMLQYKIQVYKTKIDDMEHLGELGSGTCGHVVQMLHKPSKQILAVKVCLKLLFSSCCCKIT